MTIGQVSFKGTYLIPFSQMQGADAHAKMRAIGQETAKFTDINNMQQTKDGIVVNIDDKKEKEYLAVIAKYGVNLQKMATPVQNGQKGDVESYRFMMSKLYPAIADEETARYANMPEGDYKSKMYLDTYWRFKNSPYSKEGK